MVKETSEIQAEAWRISSDMRQLYEEFRNGNGELKRENADTAANIAGKNLKAISIVLADKMRITGQLRFIEKVKAIEP